MVAERIRFEEGVVPDFFISPSVRVAQIDGKGLGVVASETIMAGEIVECCPTIVLKPSRKLEPHWRRLHQVILETLLDEHHYWWTSRYGALPLGYGCLYNHSDNPTIDTHRFLKERKIVLVANQMILEGQELTRRYHKVWFKPT